MCTLQNAKKQLNRYIPSFFFPMQLEVTCTKEKPLPGWEESIDKFGEPVFIDKTSRWVSQHFVYSFFDYSQLVPMHIYILK